MKKTVFLTCLALFLFLAGSAFADINFTLSSTSETFTYGNSWALGLDASAIKGNDAAQTTLKSAINSGSYTSGTLTLQDLQGTYDPWCTTYLQLLDDSGEFNYYTSSGWKSFNQATDYGRVSTRTVPFDYNGGNSFTEAGKGYQMDTISGYDGSKTAYSFSLDANDLSAINGYLANSDNNFGLGFDPHCTYTYAGITLTLNGGTPGTPVPEPATMVLFGMGLVGFAAVARKRLPKK